MSLFRKNLKGCPPFDDFLQGLKELWETDKSSYSQEDIWKLYFSKAVVSLDCYARMPAETINMLPIARGRMIGENENKSLISTFSYPHPAICRSNGRANIIGSPVFYGSDTAVTAIMETRPEENKEFYLSIWKVNCDRVVQYISYIHGNLQQSNPWYEHGLNVSKYLSNLSKVIVGDKHQQVEALFNFNSSVFILETPNYALTSWLANVSLYKTSVVDFIVYPSVTTDRHTCNMAFHPNFVDKYIELDCVYKADRGEATNGKFNVKFVSVGRVKHTHIEWRPLSDEEKQKLSSFAPKS